MAKTVSSVPEVITRSGGFELPSCLWSVMKQGGRVYWRVKMTGGPQGVLFPFSHDTPSSLKWFASMNV